MNGDPQKDIEEILFKQIADLNADADKAMLEATCIGIRISKIGVLMSVLLLWVCGTQFYTGRWHVSTVLLVAIASFTLWKGSRDYFKGKRQLRELLAEAQEKAGGEPTPPA